MSARVAAGTRDWGWVRHLREGGTMPWTDWTAPAPPAGRVVPSAQQLELLRRLNAAGRPSPRLVERVLHDSPPGRGQPDLPLVGAAAETGFGPAPVDPAALPARELLRVAAAVIAEDLVAAGLPDPPRPGTTRPWRTRYRLVGDPELTGRARAQLVRLGRPPGGRRAVVLVVAAPLDRMLAHAWTRRSFDTGPPAWPTWLRRQARHDQLPAQVDVLRQARLWARRVGRERVEVVADPDLLGRRLGVRRPLATVAEVPAAVPDLARRVAGLLALHVPADRRALLLRRVLRPRLESVSGQPLLVPERHAAWVAGHAQRMADGLRADGYAVHGDLDGLWPGRRSGVVTPDPTVTLDVAIGLMLEEDAP